MAKNLMGQVVALSQPPGPMSGTYFSDVFRTPLSFLRMCIALVRRTNRLGVGNA